MHRVAHRVAVCARVIDGRSVYFFQAEDGIRDIGVTGVQTCALPICVPGLDQALAAVRSGDTLVVPKLDRLDRLARSVPDARAIGDSPVAPGCSLYSAAPAPTPKTPGATCYLTPLPPSPSSQGNRPAFAPPG